jgi:hypothetical protein
MTENERPVDAPPVAPGRVSRVTRLTLIVIAALAAALALWWFSVLRDVKRAVALYDAGQTQEAASALRPAINSPVAALVLREKARHALGLCLSLEASRLAQREPTRAGYEQALRMLEEAQSLAGPTGDITAQVREYTAALARLDAKTPPPPPRHQVFSPPPEPKPEPPGAIKNSPTPAEKPEQPGLN